MSGLFENVYTPDVLSCLANLSNDEVFTPPEVVNNMLDMLPQELFESSETTFLDPACKTGVFLREIAKRLLEGQLPGYQERNRKIEEKRKEGKELSVADEKYLELLQATVDHIFQKQLFGIAITELTSLLSRRGVYCSKYPNSEFSVTKFADAQGNIRFKRTEHTWKNGKCVFCGASQTELGRDETHESYAYELIHKRNPEKIFDMKFDVIISNPPYQLNTNGGVQIQAIPIYNKFVLAAKKLEPQYIAMITPSRWFAGGMGLDSFRDDMLHDDRLCYIHDFPEANDCFPGVQIKGGVSYFLWDKTHTGNCTVVTQKGKEISKKTMRPLLEDGCDTFIRFNIGVDILKKVRLVDNSHFDKMITSQMPFGLKSAYKGKEISSKNDILLYENGRTSYVGYDDISKNSNLIDEYKVFISKVGSGSDKFPHQIIGKPFFGDKHTACTETFLAIGPFKSKIECENVMSYINTKFFRFMVLLKKNSQNALRIVYSFVPLQDFSKSWTDEELYAKYNLTQEEIDFIESMIKPME